MKKKIIVSLILVLFAGTALFAGNFTGLSVTHNQKHTVAHVTYNKLCGVFALDGLFAAGDPNLPHDIAYCRGIAVDGNSDASGLNWHIAGETSTFLEGILKYVRYDYGTNSVTTGASLIANESLRSIAVDPVNSDTNTVYLVVGAAFSSSVYLIEYDVVGDTYTQLGSNIIVGGEVWDLVIDDVANPQAGRIKVFSSRGSSNDMTYTEFDLTGTVHVNQLLDIDPDVNEASMDELVAQFAVDTQRSSATNDFSFMVGTRAWAVVCSYDYDISIFTQLGAQQNAHYGNWTRPAANNNDTADVFVCPSARSGYGNIQNMSWNWNNGDFGGPCNYSTPGGAAPDDQQPYMPALVIDDSYNAVATESLIYTGFTDGTISSHTFDHATCGYNWQIDNLAIWSIDPLSPPYRTITHEGHEIQFALDPYAAGSEVDLTIQVSPDNLGIDTVSPGLGSNSVPQGCDVAISASRYVDCPTVQRFDHWEGDGIADPFAADTTVLMDAAKTVTAVFVDDRACGDECHPINELDVDDDCDIDYVDFSGFSAVWMECTHPNCPGF